MLAIVVVVVQARIILERQLIGGSWHMLRTVGRRFHVAASLLAGIPFVTLIHFSHTRYTLSLFVHKMLFIILFVVSVLFSATWLTHHARQTFDSRS